MRKFLFKLFVSGGLLFAFIVGYGSFCDFFFTQKIYFDLTEKKQWVLSLEGGKYDYAVLGSSRAFGAFDMNLLDSLTGWDGVNLGSNGSGFKDNYLILNQFLKSNSTNRLFLQVDMASLNSDLAFSNEFHAFTFFPYWDDQIIQEVLKEEIPILDNLFSVYIPQWRYFYFNKYFSPKEVIRRVNFSDKRPAPYAKSKGGIARKEIIQSEGKIKTYDLPKTADLEDWNYLMKIRSMAEDFGIEVVFFAAPRYKDTQEEVKEQLSLFSNSKIFADGFDVSNPCLFLDQGHLNWYGRRDFSFIFSKAIKEF